MASKRWKAFRGNIGFYTTMAVCLVSIAVSGYFLLADEPDKKPVETPPADTEASSVADLAEDTAAEVLAPDPGIPEPLPERDPEPVTIPLPEEPPAKEEVAVIAPQPVPDSEPVVAEAPRLVVTPLKGEVLAAFSVETLVYNKTLDDWRTHDGVDIAAAVGTTVMAASAGTVAAVFGDSLMGTTVILNHTGGYETTYSNLQPQPPVKVGDVVSAGQIIGAVGTTAPAESAQAPHLHFSVSRNGTAMDPDEFLKR